MKMQKEEKVVIVLLLMALGSLSVAFWAFEADDSGLSVDGHILETKPTKSGGNLLIPLDSTPLQIFILARAGASDIKNKETNPSETEFGSEERSLSTRERMSLSSQSPQV